MRAAALALLAALVALPAAAEAPVTSLRPEARPAVAAPAPPAAPAAPPAAQAPAASRAPSAAPAPSARPRGFGAMLRGLFESGDGHGRSVRYANPVCGLPDVAGVAVQPIPGRLSGCGIEAPVRVAAVAGVALDRPAVMNCRTARALRDWVAGGVVPAFERMGGGAASMTVAAGYACRTRNNRPGGRISEHGRGSAIDISAFRLRDGREITVLQGWRALGSRTALRAAWRSACGPFGTVLGPGSDRFHSDHLHLDTAASRSGSYCR